MRQDLGYAIRMLRRTPGSPPPQSWRWPSASAAHTIIFSVVDAVLLRPLPYDHPERLVVINERSPQSDQMSVSYADYQDWRAQNTVFDDMAARNNETFNLTGLGDADRFPVRTRRRRSSRCCASRRSPAVSSGARMTVPGRRRW